MKLLFFLFIFLVSTQAHELKKVSVQLQWKHQFEYAGFYAAIEQGYYRNLGLELEIKEMKKDLDPLHEVLVGNSDFGVSYSSIVAQYYKGKPILMIANIFKTSALVLISQKEILSPADLKGKKVMGSTRELTSTGIGMMLNHFNIKAKDFKLIPSTHTTEAFEKGEIDAMTAFITNQPYQLEQKNIPYNILNPSSYGSQFYDVNIFTSQALFEKDPITVRNFRDATIKGWHYALKNSDEIIHLILEKYNTQNKTYEALKYEAEITKSLILENVYSLGSIDCNVIEEMKQTFLDLNFIPKFSTKNKNAFILDNNCDTEFSTILSKEELDYIKNKDEIKVCADPDWMPFEKIREGKLIGMSADYLKLLEDKLNVPFNVLPVQSWVQSVEFAKQRKCDIFSLAMKTPSRKEYMNFTSPHLSIPLVITTTTDKLFITDFKNVLQQKFGAVKGYAFTELLRLKYPGVKIIEYKNIHEGLAAVDKGKIYGFIDNLNSTAYQLQKKYISSLKITGRIDQQWELGVGVRNDDPMLLSILDKTLKSIDEKQKQKILNTWTSVTYERESDYSYLWKVFALIIIIILVILYRYKEIKKFNKELIEYNENLRRLSITDALTGLHNRRYLDDMLHNEYERAQRYKSTFSIILIDIDDFKKINDTYGHDKGDDVLKAISSTLVKNSRVNDIVGRWGGEEFMIVCQSATKKAATHIAEKMRKSIQENDYNLENGVTASFGVLEYHADKSYRWHISSVDKALYQAKSSGKNTVIIYE